MARAKLHQTPAISKSHVLCVVEILFIPRQIAMYLHERQTKRQCPLQHAGLLACLALLGQASSLGVILTVARFTNEFLEDRG
jgi:hypothetical protein